MGVNMQLLFEHYTQLKLGLIFYRMFLSLNNWIGNGPASGPTTASSISYNYRQ